MTRSCACCRMPAQLAVVHPGEVDGVGVLIGLCARCAASNARLPPSTRQKRLNAAAERAARDTSGDYYTARFPDPGAAVLTAHLLGHPGTAADTGAALGWK